MNILLVHNYYQIPGGEDTVVANEKKLLEDNGCQVIMYTRNSRELQDFSLFKKLLLPFTAIFSVKTYRDIRKLIKKYDIEYVHVHNTLSLISPSVYYAGFSQKIPVIQTLHNFRMVCPGATLYRQGQICEECLTKGLFCGIRHGCYRSSHVQTLVSAAVLWLHRKLGTYRRVYFLCLTAFNRDKILSAVNGKDRIFDTDKFFVKPNFVDCSIKPIPYQARKEQYLYVGRLDPLKGIRQLFKQWSRMPDKKLLVCGTGPEEEWCRQYLSEHRVENIEILGQLGHEQVLKLMAKSKALVFPTQWYEGQPMTILESYAVGTPVIGTRIGNVADMVEDGVTGWLVQSDLADIRNVIGKLDGQMSEKCYQRYQDRYSSHSAYKNFVEIWERIQKRGDRG